MVQKHRDLAPQGVFGDLTAILVDPLGFKGEDMCGCAGKETTKVGGSQKMKRGAGRGSCEEFLGG